MKSAYLDYLEIIIRLNYFFIYIAASFFSNDKNDIIEILLSNGADINIQNNAGETPLHQGELK